MTKVFVIDDSEISSIKSPSISSLKDEDIGRNISKINLDKCTVLGEERKEKLRIPSKNLEVISAIDHCNNDRKFEFQADKNTNLSVITRKDNYMEKDNQCSVPSFVLKIS